MTQATHTPGPFWYSRSATPEHSPQYTVYAENGDGRDLAIVKGDNAERDAILIAAAPDMLAALVAMVNDADSTGCEGCAVVSAQFIIQAEAAIAKAVQS